VYNRNRKTLEDNSTHVMRDPINVASPHLVRNPSSRIREFFTFVRTNPIVFTVILATEWNFYIEEF